MNDAKPRPEITASQAERIERRREVSRALELLLENKHKRLMNRISDKRKQRFIDAFLSESCIDRYPIDEDDVLDANERHPAQYEESLHKELTAQVARAYVLNRYRGTLPNLVATDLLASDMGDQLLLFADLKLPDVSVELTLAHLETLGFGFPPAVAMSIAHRATLLLLNRRFFRDARA